MSVMITIAVAPRATPGYVSYLSSVSADAAAAAAATAAVSKSHKMDAFFKRITPMFCVRGICAFPRVYGGNIFAAYLVPGMCSNDVVFSFLPMFAHPGFAYITRRPLSSTSHTRTASLRCLSTLPPTSSMPPERLVESVGHSWIHLEEFPHEPPGYYFDPRLGLPKAGQLLQRSALFHYVPGGYMHYLHFLSSNACTCSVTPAESSAALGEVAIGVYSATRRLSKLDEKRIGNTWGNGVPQYALLKASGKGYPGVKGDVTRLHELREAFPDAPWLLLLPVEHFVVTANLAKRMRALEADNVPGKRALMVYGLSVEGKSLRNGESTEALPGDGALLVGEDLVKTIFDFEEPLIGGVFPYRQLPGDRGVVEFCRTISWPTVVEDPGFVRRLPGPEWTGDAGCPATFPMDPDLADLKPEFTMSEGDAAMAVAKFLLGTAGDRECVTRLDAPTKID